MDANTVTLYRIGPVCKLEPWNNGSREAEPVTVRLRGGVWIQTGVGGEVLFYTHERSIGLGLNTALVLNLCQHAESERVQAEEALRQREHRAAEQERLAQAVRRLVRAVSVAAELRSPLGQWASRPGEAETVEALAEYFERIAAERGQ